MTARLARLLVVAVLAGSVAGSLVGAGEARACECQVPDLRTALENADVIVGGRVIDYRDDTAGDDADDIDRHWLYEVSTRYRGDTPDVISIDLSTELGECDDIRVQLPPFLLLQRGGEDSLYFPACEATPTENELSPYFDEPWPVDGEGPPTAIVSVATADHDLALIDGIGRMLGYLPGEGRTIGLALCPGDRFFVQVREARADGPTQHELVRWRFDGLVREEVITIPRGSARLVSASEPLIVACRDGEGTDVAIGGSHDSLDYIGGEFSAGLTFEGQRFVFGPDSFALVAGYPEVAVVGPLVAGGDDNVDRTVVLKPEGFGYSDDLWDPPTAIRPTTFGWQLTFSLGGGREIQVVDVTTEGVAQLGPSAYVPELTDGPSLLLPIGVRDAIGVEQASSGPMPLFQRSGERIDAPAPTLPPPPSGTQTIADSQIEDTADSQAMTRSDDGAASVAAPSTEAPPIEASVEPRTVRLGRVAGLGALVVLALLGAFGLRQMWRARESD